jgi:polysaccharide biosynthesis protein VpsJ
MVENFNNSLKIKRICDAILASSRNDDFCGYDPFDGLNSKLFHRLGIDNSNLARIAWLQFHKRSPINFRRVVGIDKERNPKGVALFILGLVERYKLHQSPEDLELANDLADWLLDSAVDKNIWGHYAWGYHFDWAARAFFVPKGKPNAITTCYVARALRALGEICGEEKYIKAADDAGYFLDQLYTEKDGLEYYAYIPGEVAFVHNASLWTAAVISRTAANVGDSPLGERALRVARQSIRAQAEDGSWPYGNRSHHSFIDGFHTGYNLEALNEIQMIDFDRNIQESIESGLEFYRKTFFMDDGAVKYYSGSIWPIDMHSVSQAILTLLKVGGTDRDRELTGRVVNWSIENLYCETGGRFVYQIGRLFSNKINYLRWTQAWAFYAFSFYSRDLEAGLGKW